LTYVNLERPTPHPDQEDIDKIRDLLKEIRDILTDFVENDFQRLSQSLITKGVVDPNYFVDFSNKYVPLIRQWIYDADGYIQAHRYDPNFKDAVRSSGFFRPEIDTKKDWLDKVKNFWYRFKHGSSTLVLKCTGVVFEGIDNILESLAKFIPGLEGLIEIKKHIKNVVSAAEVASEALF
jgi:hypothetical protein